MKINQRGFTLIELLIFLGVLAVVGVWVATQGSNVFSASKTERAVQQIEAITDAAESYRHLPSQRGLYTGISITILDSLGYPLEPLTNGVNQNVYGLSTGITTSGATNASLSYDTHSADDCNQLRLRFINQSNLAGAPVCAGNNLVLTLD